MAKADKPNAMPKFTPAPDALVRLFENALKDFPTAEPRKVFGYPAAFIHGQMFAGLHQDHMILRLSEPDRAKFMAEHRTGLFEPMPGRAMKEYVLVPPAVRRSPAALKGWMEKALGYAQSLPPKVKAKKKK